MGFNFNQTRGKKAQNNGKDAEKEFDLAAKRWKALGVGYFITANPEARTSIVNGKAKFWRNTGYFDRPGSIKGYSVNVEIKHAQEKNFQWKRTNKSLQTEFYHLHEFAKIGAFACFLIRERKIDNTNTLFTQWYLVRVTPQMTLETLPNRKYWVKIRLDDFPQMVLSEMDKP